MHKKLSFLLAASFSLAFLSLYTIPKAYAHDVVKMVYQSKSAGARLKHHGKRLKIIPASIVGTQAVKVYRCPSLPWVRPQYNKYGGNWYCYTKKVTPPKHLLNQPQKQSYFPPYCKKNCK
jgi:hypothetical protein